MIKKLVYLLMMLGVVSLLFPQVFAGTTGKISGKITNEETGEPLPGVAVSIVGTKMGALTNEDGEFNILNVPVGNYTVKASLIGFAPVEVQNLDVTVDLTTYTDFALSKKALELGRTIVVTAERPMIIKDKTGSIKVVEAEEIQQMPTRGYEELVAQQAGVVRFRSNFNTAQRGTVDRQPAANQFELNVRGGRSSEVAYFVDGFSQQDPLSGMSTTNINNNALEEVEIKTGGFSAEYGWVASAVVNTTTKEGTAEYSGSVEAVTDNIPGMADEDVFDYNIYSANVGGPVPGLEGSSFFLSGERRWYGDRQPSALFDGPLPYNSLSGWSGQGKISFRVNDNVNLKVGGLYSFDKWREYRHNYYFDAEHMPKYEDQNYSVYGKWTHTVNPNTFYSVAVSLFQTERIRGDGKHFDNLEDYLRPNGNPSLDETSLFWSWDDMDEETGVVYGTTADSGWYYIDSTYDSASAAWEYHDSLEYTIFNDTSGNYIDGYEYLMSGDEGHVWDDFFKRKSGYLGADIDFTTQMMDHHLVKFGLDFQRHTLRYYRALTPVIPGSESIDRYGYDENAEESDDEDWRNDTKHPITLAFYLQDKFEWQNLVINAGLRWDYFDNKALRVKNLESPFDPDSTTGDETLDRADLEDSEGQTRLSPRLGVAMPVSDKTVVHFNYGLFFQRPNLQNLYVGYDYFENKVLRFGYYYPFGNPNLEPEKTTAYEVGMSHQLGTFTSFELTAYYKDVQNLTQVATLPADPKAYQIYFNQDFGTIKGLDFALVMRRNKGMSINANYSLSWANGTGSFASTQQNIAWTVSESPVQTAPLAFDMRHKFTGIVDFRAGKGQGPKFGDIYPLENAGMNFLVSLSSGLPYTPMKLDADPVTLLNVSYNPAAPINSRYSDWKFRIDMKANKAFNLANLNLEIYVWVLNLLDRKNTVAVYESSGDGESTNWISTPAGEVFASGEGTDVTGLDFREKYELKQRDPMNFDTPRQIRFGIRASF